MTLKSKRFRVTPSKTGFTISCQLELLIRLLKRGAIHNNIISELSILSFYIYPSPIPTRQDQDIFAAQEMLFPRRKEHIFTIQQPGDRKIRKAKVLLGGWNFKRLKTCRGPSKTRLERITGFLTGSLPNEKALHQFQSGGRCILQIL